MLVSHRSLACLAAVVAISSVPGANSFAFAPQTMKSNNRGNVDLKARSQEGDGAETFRQAISGAVVALTLFTSPMASLADGQTKDFKLPPIDVNDKTRCVLNSSAMGQANAARDKLYDLRQCNLSGKDASGFDLSGVIMTDTNLSNAKLKEAQFSKAYLHDSNFDGADFTNGIIDRASFKGSSLKGTIFGNAVLTGTSFEGANVENADFTDAYIGEYDIRNLCKNPTLKGENPVTGVDTRFSANCVGKNQ